MATLRSAALTVLIGSGIVGSPACDGVAAPDTGTLDVSITGFPPGLRLPLAELALVLDGDIHRFQTYDPAPRLVLGSLAPGDYAATLQGLPSEAPADCQPAGELERTTTITAGGRSYLSFTLACTWGMLRILTATVGGGQDPDGYGVELTQECYGYYYYYYPACEPVVVAEIAVPSDGKVVVALRPDLDPHPYTARLTGVATHCITPAPIAFAYPDQASIGFTVSCASGSGSRAGRR